jgi:hypothetical protein
MLMKKNLYNVIFTVIIFTVIAGVLLISTTKCNSYLPYTPIQYHPFEGFSDYSSGTNIKYSNVNDNLNTDSGINNYTIEQKVGDCESPYGFNGLFCKPGVADTSIDIFSTASSNPSCFGNSSGLSNSKGSLCLDNNLMTMLKTRGGNQTSGDMQIGSN